MSIIRKQLHIKGMSCVNCQNKIEQTLCHMTGIEEATVSYNKGIADITYDTDLISLEDIIHVIEDLDYKVVSNKAQQNPMLVDVICTLVIIICLYSILECMGILNLLVPSQLADSNMGYGMLFVIGLITSVHCIAMCGGINLSQCLPQGQQNNASNKKSAAFQPAIFYNLGRVVSYTAIGFVLGLVGFLIGGGTKVGMSILLQGILKMIAGLFMVVMGINMLGIFPWMRKFTLRMPKSLARKIGQEKSRSNRPFYVGILNGFMPCGPLQSMWIVALATENPFTGALSMFLFSLGTVPLMLGLGSIVSALGRKFTDKVMTAGAILVVVLGLAMLSQGGSLSGWLPPELLMLLLIAFCIAGVLISIPVKKEVASILIKAAAVVIIVASIALWNVQGIFISSASSTDSNTEVEVVEGVQVVNSTLSPGKYPNITVQAGVPVKWIIDAPEGSINGCNYKMQIPAYNIEYTFQRGENIIEFTPEKAETVQYSCWMGMIRANIFVTDGIEGDSNVAQEEITSPIPAGITIPTETIAIAAKSVENEVQEVSISLTEEGFEPAIIVVEAGRNVIWNIENTLTNAELLAPYCLTKLSLSVGTNQLALYPSESFEVSTGDNQFYAYVKVVEDIDSIDEESIRQEVSQFETLIYPSSIFESFGASCCY